MIVLSLELSCYVSRMVRDHTVFRGTTAAPHEFTVKYPYDVMR